MTDSPTPRYYTAQAAPFLVAHMELYHAAVEVAGWHVCASDNYLAPFFEPRAVRPCTAPDRPHD